LISLQAQSEKIVIHNVNFYDLVIGFDKTLQDVTHFYNQVGGLLTEVDHVLGQLTSGSQIEVNGDYATLIGNVVSFSEKLIDIPGFKKIVVESPFNGELQFYIQHGARLLTDVRTRAYSAAIFEFALVIQRSNTDPENKLLPRLLKYGSFMANMANAETSEDVKNAIDAVALPAGSARIKRETTFNIEINGFVSAFGGEEKYSFEENGIRGARWRPVAGLTAPIGLAFSLSPPHGKNCKSGFGSFTLLGSIIDLGAITSFRFKDPGVSELPEVKLANIFSPGAFVIYGIPRTPISFGYGWQYGPALRHIDDKAATITSEKFYGWRFFIGADIPLFSIYTKPRK
jgi:hypothetical protein